MKLRHFLMVAVVGVLCLAAAATVPGRPLVTIRVTSIDAALRDLEAISKGSQNPVTRDGLLTSFATTFFGTDDVSFIDLTQPAAIVLPQDGPTVDWNSIVAAVPVRDGARALDAMARTFPERTLDGDVTVFRSAPMTAPDGTESRTTVCAAVHGRILVVSEKPELVRRFDHASALSGEGMPPGSIAVSMEIEPVAARWKAGLEQTRRMIMSRGMPSGDGASGNENAAAPPAAGGDGSAMAPPPPSAVVGSHGPGEPILVVGDVKPPQLVTKITPEYPVEARRARVEGNVILEAIITAEGNVEAVRVLRSVPELDQAAIDAVKQWKYDPAVQNGRPVKVFFTVIVTFSLRDDQGMPMAATTGAAETEPQAPPAFDPRKLAGVFDLYFGLMSDAIDSLAKLQLSFEVSDGYLVVHGRGVAKNGSPMKAFIDAQRDVGLPAIGRMMPAGAPVIIAGQLNWTAPARAWMKQLTQRSQTAMADIVHMAPEANRASNDQMLQRMNLWYANSGPMTDCLRGDIAVAMDSHPDGMRMLTVQGISDTEACRGVLAATIGKKAGTGDQALITKEVLEPEKITTYVMKQPQLLMKADAPPQELTFRYAEVGHIFISGTEPWASKAIREAAAVSEGHTPGGGGLVLADLGPFTQRPGVFGRVQVGTFMRQADTALKARRDAKAKARAVEGAEAKEPATGTAKVARPDDTRAQVASPDEEDPPVTQDAIEAEARREDLIRALEGPAGGIPFAIRFDEGAATVEVALPLAMFEAISKSMPKPAPRPEGADADEDESEEEEFEDFEEP